MIYTHMDIWMHNGVIWHSLYTPGTRELSMGVLRPYEVTRSIAWAKSHNLTITDKRQ